MNSERTCIGCRSRMRKGSMARIHKGADGAVRIDMDGRGPGRGAYVCSIECFDRAKDEKRFAPALRTRIDDGALEAMAGDVKRALAMLDAKGKE